MENAAATELYENMQNAREGAFDSEIMMIPYEKLKRSPLNKFKIENMDDLKSSIASLGIITPLSVIGPDGEGFYEIISGERRYHAIGDLMSEGADFAEVPCHLIGNADMNEKEKELLIEESNIETRDIENKDHHRYKIAKLLLEIDGDDSIREKGYAKRLADRLGVSPRYARMFRQILSSGSEELQNAMLDENFHAATATTSYVAGMDEESQAEFVKRVKNGENDKQAYEAVKQKAAQKREREEKARQLSGMSDIDLAEDAQAASAKFFDSLGNDDSGLGSLFGQGTSEDGFGDVDITDTIKYIRNLIYAPELTEEEERLFAVCREWVLSRQAS